MAAGTELWDVYDGFFRKTDRVQERGGKLLPGDYHLVVHIFPVNDKKEVLIQKRSKRVTWKPGMWAATGGAAIQGESLYDACLRELYEEVGIAAKPEEVELAAVFRRENSFNSVWIIRTNKEISELKLQEEEVEEARWVTLKQIQEMMDIGEFQYYSYFNWLCAYLS